MDDLASLPDGLVLLPKAGGYSPEQLMAQQELVNQARAVRHAGAQVQNLSFQSAVTRVNDSVVGLLDDWTSGRRSVSDLALTDNRLQGLGLLLIVAALGGLVIDAVLVR